MAQSSAVKKVLATAAKEIGYSRWTDKKRGTKYARETQPVFWPRDTWLLANGISFCDIFVTWVFWKALGKDFVNKGYLPAGASYNTDYRASKGGRVSKPPRPGDVLVFDWNWATPATNHVGILEKVLPSGNYQTIEGNTSSGASGSQSNGGGVYRRTRRPGQVRYVIRPNWSQASGASTPQEVWEKSPRIRGMSKAEVRGIQELLLSAGYSVGSYGADGVYKGDTVAAVKKAQKALKLTVDGVAGPDTVAALKKVQSDVSAPPKEKAPPFPLPRKPGALYYYGPSTGPKTSVSGKGLNTAVPNDVVRGGKLGWYSRGLMVWQKAAGIAADGRFGDETERTAKALQKKHGEKVDGKIGPATWKLAFL